MNIIFYFLFSFLFALLEYGPYYVPNEVSLLGRSLSRPARWPETNILRGSTTRTIRMHQNGQRRPVIYNICPKHSVAREPEYLADAVHPQTH